MVKIALLSFVAMLLMPSVYGEGVLNRFVDFEKNAAELKFVENPDFWAKEVDFSALSVWNDATKDMWGGGCERRNLAGVAISPRHVLCSHHYGIPTGTTLYFLGPKSGVVGRKVLASDYVAQGADLRVCLLDEDLPRDITPLKILPKNFADYLGDGKGITSVTMNQYRELVVQKLNVIPAYENRTQLLSATKPVEVEDAAKYKTVISGDSGCPRFLIVDNEPVLISLMWKGGSGSGVFIPHFRREIQETMDRLAKGYELECASLASLPLYTPPSTEIKSPAPSPTAPTSGNDEEGDDEDDIYDFVIIEDEYEDDYEEAPVERVDIAAITCTNGVVSVEFKWPQDMEIHKWDVFLKGYAELNGGVTLSKKYNPTSGTNLVVSVTAADFPENVLPHKYFFKAEAVKDSDHDGLSDELEIEWGTNPNVADSDNDGLSDKFEVDNNFDPTNDDMDGDGVKDGVEYNRGTSQWIDEAEMETIEGVFYEILGTCQTDVYPYDPSTNTTQNARSLPESLLPNDPGIFSSIGYEIADTVSNAFYIVKHGLQFKPTRSGFFAFRIAADDRAEVSIEDLKVTDHWQIVGDEAVGYFEEGVPYGIEAKVWNNGGRTYLNFLEFAEFRAYSVKMKNELSGDTIIFEDSYENKPGKWIPKNSTSVTSQIYMNAGMRGGRFELKVEGYDKLDFSGGEGLPERLDVMLEPGGSFSRFVKIKGANPSREENDVKIKMKFTENETGHILESEECLTVFKVTMQMGIGIDASNRHIFGPLERVSLWHEPIDIPATWSYLYVELDDVNQSQDGSYWYATNHVTEIVDMSVSTRVLPYPSKYSAVFSVKGIDLEIPITVIAPKGRIGESPGYPSEAQWLETTEQSNIQLAEHWCAYSMDVYLLPCYVSFDWVRIKEGVCESANCFGSLAFGAQNPHNEEAGAGRIINVDETNKAGYDIVSVEGVCPTNGSWRGSCDWNIPVFWQPVTEPTNNWSQTTPFTRNKELFRCNSRGTLSIQKMKCFGKRDLNDIMECKTLYQEK